MSAFRDWNQYVLETGIFETETNMFAFRDWNQYVRFQGQEPACGTSSFRAADDLIEKKIDLVPEDLSLPLTTD